MILAKMFTSKSNGNDKYAATLHIAKHPLDQGLEKMFFFFLFCKVVLTLITDYLLVITDLDIIDF